MQRRLPRHDPCIILRLEEKTSRSKVCTSIRLRPSSLVGLLFEVATAFSFWGTIAVCGAGVESSKHLICRIPFLYTVFVPLPKRGRERVIDGRDRGRGRGRGLGIRYRAWVLRPRAVAETRVRQNFA